MAEKQAENARALKLIEALVEEVNRNVSEAERGAGISGAQYWALSAVVDEPGIRVTGVANLLGIHRSTASNLIESLVRLDLLKKAATSDDRRGVALHPTKTGLSLCEKASRSPQQLLAAALSALSEEQLSALSDGTASLIRAIRKLR